MSETDFVPANNVEGGNWAEDTQGIWESVSLLNDWEAAHPNIDLKEGSPSDWGIESTDAESVDWSDAILLNEWETGESESANASQEPGVAESASWGDDCCSDEEEEVPPTLTQRIDLGGAATKWKIGEFEGMNHCISPVFGSSTMQGFVDGNDCSIVNINENQATVYTMDWFPPTVDDPYAFGAISASAALSKLYAVGAKPLTALNIMALPCKMGLDSVGDVMKGGSDKVIEAGAFVVGGHSIDDGEPKYGLATFGLAHPDEIIHNENAKPGDAIYLTKPLGTGILERALHAELENDESLQEAIGYMMELNKNASEAMLQVKATAAAFVSESGLAGHLRSILESCEASAELDWNAIPILDRAWEYCIRGYAPKRATEIFDWVGNFVYMPNVTMREAKNRMNILCDPQTSGGLIVVVDGEDAGKFEKAFEELSGRKPSRIGSIIEGSEGTISVL